MGAASIAFVMPSHEEWGIAVWADILAQLVPLGHHVS